MRYLPLLLVLGVQIYALIDCILTPSDQARHMPKAAWFLVILLVPLVGAASWLFLGRPRGGASEQVGGGASPGRVQGPIGPEDDPEFLAQLREIDIEHQRMLKQWEEDLRRREQDLRDESDQQGGTDKDRPD